METEDFIQSLTELSKEYLKGEKVYVLNIPDKVLKNAYKAFKLPQQERIIAIIDTTIFSHGKDGFIVAESGLYMKLLMFRNYISWESFKMLTLEASGKEDVKFSDEIDFRFSNDQVSRDDMMDYLNRVQRLLMNPDPIVEGSDHPAEEEQMGEIEVDEAFIQQLCHPYSRVTSFFTGDALASKKTDNLPELYPISPEETVFAIYDRTFFDKGNLGIVITTKGIYWRNSASHVGSGIQWSQFGRAVVEPESDSHIRLGKGLLIQSIYSRVEMLELLSDLQLYIASLRADNNPICYKFDSSYTSIWNLPMVELDEEKWMLVENGMPLIPLRTNSLRWVIETEQVDLKRLYVWKRGMTEWISIQEAAEFTPLIRNRSSMLTD